MQLNKYTFLEHYRGEFDTVIIQKRCQSNRSLLEMSDLMYINFRLMTRSAFFWRKPLDKVIIALI